MLKSVDILIGLSVIMLVASMAVTMITQALINIAGSRGRKVILPFLTGVSGFIEPHHIFLTVLRRIPKYRVISRSLLPSTITAR